jgi:uncharacterized membrane protein YidH (DUF202 family)
VTGDPSVGPAGPGQRGAVAGLQHERTTLAWERTAFSLMGAGVVLGRFAAVNELVLAEVIALPLVVLGAVLLVWAGAFYERRAEHIAASHDVAHPGAARLVGTVAVAATGASLAAGIVVVANQVL